VTVTGDYLDTGSMADAAAFQAVLGEAVERALKADVDARGAWEVEIAGSTHLWDVEIVELAEEHGPD
jgi:hypothetical protein